MWAEGSLRSSISEGVGDNEGSRGRLAVLAVLGKLIKFLRSIRKPVASSWLGARGSCDAALRVVDADVAFRESQNSGARIATRDAQRCSVAHRFTCTYARARLGIL